ncbi:hypothetical protein BU15DRAFT_69050 [Melanogaster broomeanus]|nr:hypothetical protein BU15DRAFT_69050 [Melanogaster broomeanus]
MYYDIFPGRLRCLPGEVTQAMVATSTLWQLLPTSGVLSATFEGQILAVPIRIPVISEDHDLFVQALAASSQKSTSSRRIRRRLKRQHCPEATEKLGYPVIPLICLYFRRPRITAAKLRKRARDVRDVLRPAGSPTVINASRIWPFWLLVMFWQGIQTRLDDVAFPLSIALDSSRADSSTDPESRFDGGDDDDMNACTCIGNTAVTTMTTRQMI